MYELGDAIESSFGVRVTRQERQGVLAGARHKPELLVWGVPTVAVAGQEVPFYMREHLPQVLCVGP
jgi:hypothetical protein